MSTRRAPCDCAVCAEAGRGEDPAVNTLTGGDWENRANEYWRAWHNSALVAWEEQTRAERAEAEVARLFVALYEIAVCDAVQRDPDGDDQAAVMIARETLGMELS